MILNLCTDLRDHEYGMSNNYQKLICFLCVLPQLCYGPVMRQKEPLLLIILTHKSYESEVSEIWEQKPKPETRTASLCLSFIFELGARLLSVLVWNIYHLWWITLHLRWLFFIRDLSRSSSTTIDGHAHILLITQVSGVRVFWFFDFSDQLLLETRVPLINLQVSASAESLLLPVLVSLCVWFNRNL